MIFFYDDYSEGAHPEVLSKLTKNNDKPQLGYGYDEYSKATAKLISNKVGGDTTVHFISGGTQTNLISLSHILRPYEAVVAADCAHINNHEAGALEATGHKVVAIPTVSGKMKPEDVDRVIRQHDEYMVKLRVLEITQATEQGTVYSLAELKELISVAKKHGLLVYMDGARLPHALTSHQADFTLADLPKIGVDLFYIGGTKNGALCGEAVVIVNDSIKPDFAFSVRQRGGTLAKGRILSLQFMALFENDLWLKLAKHANDMATKLSAGVVSAGLELAYPTDINQVFVNLSPDQTTKLGKKYGFHIIDKPSDDRWVARLVCSWATEESQVLELIQDLG